MAVLDEELQMTKKQHRPTKIESVATWLLVGCAVALTSVVVRRDVAGGDTVVDDFRLSPVTSFDKIVDNWEKFAQEGISVGSEGAPVTIIEFADFKCGFCRELAPILKQIREEYPSEIRLIYRHYVGASGHPEARAAAEAGECAARAGMFEPFHDELYKRSNLTGDNAYSDLFEELGGEDLEGFVRCTESAWVQARLTADLAAVRTLGIHGTPTLLVNGEVIVGLVPRDTIVAAVKRALEEQ